MSVLRDVSWFIVGGLAPPTPLHTVKLGSGATRQVVGWATGGNILTLTRQLLLCGVGMQSVEGAFSGKTY